MKILIAEDDESIMNTYQIALKSRNHMIFSATDGDQALTIYKKHFAQMRTPESTKTDEHLVASSKIAPPFDLVILDYRMPKKNGLQVAEEILTMVTNQRVILASAYIHELEIPEYLELLQKPFGLDVLFSAVESIPIGLRAKYGQRPSTSNADILREDSVPSFPDFDERADKVSDSFNLTINSW